MRETFSLDWPKAFPNAARSAKFRTRPEDFVVKEVLGFEPSGDGAHSWVQIVKVDCNTHWVAGELAKHFGVNVRDVGYSGRKDRWGTAWQWFSVPGADGPNGEMPNGIRLVHSVRHPRKLKIGTHKANDFEITLREIDNPSGLEHNLNQIRVRGVPNYFGPQRFGRSGSNLAAADRLFSGHRLKRNQRSMALSAARSWLFNNLLAERVANDRWDRLQVGDVANLAGSGSCFVVDAMEGLEQRLAENDIHPTGLLVGQGDWLSTGPIREAEGELLAQWQSWVDGLTSQGLRAQRRSTRLLVEDLSWSWEGDYQLCLKFRLISGGYATAVLRELVDDLVEAQGSRRSST